MAYIYICRIYALQLSGFGGTYLPKRQLRVLCLALIMTFALIGLSAIRGAAADRDIADGAVTVGANGYIKWVDFKVTAELLRTALKYDLSTYEAASSGSGAHAGLVTLIALAAAKYGGELSKCRASDIKTFAERIAAGEKPDDITANPKNFAYFLEAYGAALGGFVGNYAVKTEGGLEKRYGLKVFSPIAEGYYYSDFDDFGAARSYGYRRPHLGHDLMGSVGTPIIAVESGYVEACGWNQYGGWRIGIRSFDGKRYYYYAHLRRGHPYNDMYEGKQVTAGEVIGYLGMTGYSSKEDTNNIDTPHLHFGVQLIFDKSQKDGTNQIWIDLYEYTKFLSRYRSRVGYDAASKEFNAVSPILDLDAPD